jgi:hypothetical protein
MSATTSEGTGNGSAADIKAKIYNGTVKTDNIDPSAVVTSDVADDAVTSAKIVRTALAKAPVVLSSSAVTVVAADHANTPLVLNRDAGVTVTLPAATGTGNRYSFYVGTSLSNASYIVKVANATDVISGVALGSDDETPLSGTPTAIDMWYAGANDDTFTMTHSAASFPKGGQKGNYLEVVDIAEGLFHVNAVLSQTGTEVTPFSATVS